jgi:plasmid stability protein
MATLTIRNLDERVKARLRILAAQQGNSMEEQARRILTNWVAHEFALTLPTEPLGARMHGYFADLDDPGLDLPPRSEQARDVDLPT